MKTLAHMAARSGVITDTLQKAIDFHRTCENISTITGVRLPDVKQLVAQACKSQHGRSAEVSRALYRQAMKSPTTFREDVAKLIKSKE